MGWINKENFDLPDEADFQGIRPLREEAKETYTKLFDTTFPRDDYREFWNFAWFLSEAIKKAISLKNLEPQVGSATLDQQQSKAIYAIKIVLFKRQFTLPPELLEGFISVALFVAVVYGKFWFQEPLAHLAAFND